jgi:hypothetical protein
MGQKKNVTGSMRSIPPSPTGGFALEVDFGWGGEIAMEWQGIEEMTINPKAEWRSKKLCLFQFATGSKTGIKRHFPSVSSRLCSFFGYK